MERQEIGEAEVKLRVHAGIRLGGQFMLQALKRLLYNEIATCCFWFSRRVPVVEERWACSFSKSFCFGHGPSGFRMNWKRPLLS